MLVEYFTADCFRSISEYISGLRGLLPDLKGIDSELAGVCMQGLVYFLPTLDQPSMANNMASSYCQTIWQLLSAD